MPIKIPDKLPAKKILEKENIFVMDNLRAIHQDIRPLKIALVNLMPTAIETETQIIRMLSNTPIQIEFDLVYMSTHKATHTSGDHFKTFYKSYDQIKRNNYDGLIITGAPVEMMDFEEVDYWDELKEIIEWANKNATSILFLCWAAQAALYLQYGIKKYKRKSKIIGVFPHHIVKPAKPILRGLDEGFLVPHARYTENKKEEIEKIHDLEILAESEEAGLHIVSSRDGSKIFVFGHFEYDPHTLQYEYERDKTKGLPIQLPKNYFPDNDPTKKPEITWRSNGFLFYSNWINYFVYQATPYDWVLN